MIFLYPSDAFRVGLFIELLSIAGYLVFIFSYNILAYIFKLVLKDLKRNKK